MFDTKQTTYERLRDIYAERTRSLVAWCGAGLSVPAALPTWPQLRARLHKELLSKAAGFPDQDRNRLESKAAAIATIADNWVAFDRLRKELGHSTYVAAVRDALKINDNTPVPDAYRRIWRMRVGCVLTLNLDRFASRAFFELRPQSLHEMTGRQLGSQAHVLKSQHPIVVNLHGIVDDAPSWIFTRSDFESLHEMPGYSAFLQSIFCTRTVLFLGITADDVAAGGFLERLGRLGIDTGQHFWLTSRIDANTDAWAEAAGLQVIRYTAELGHTGPIDEFFTDLERYVSTEPEAAPVIAPPPAGVDLEPPPPPDELARYAPEQIRVVLREQSAAILGPEVNQDALLRYKNFCAEYRRSIHYAWLVSTSPPDNIFFGYTVERQLGKGLFGHVYLARDKGGEPAVIKLLRQENFDDPEMVGSFRRGVRSLRILGDHHVSGVVSYKDAYELPACLIMEYVDGPDLKEAVEGHHLDVHDKLRIALDIARVIRAGHLLPERVLHRDIRPPNIMLRDFFYGDNWEVVVLDFDLSWHRGAPEKSVVVPGSFAPYLAPEQLQEVSGVSTRSAAVDSFGFGMTLYYLLTEEDPKLWGSRDAVWLSTTIRTIRERLRTGWVSLPARVARLIQRATMPDQLQRLDLGQIEAELLRMSDVASDISRVDSAELWAEELLARAFGAERYAWDEDKSVATTNLASGTDVELVGREGERVVEARIQWLFGGDRNRKLVGKYLPKAGDQAAAALRRAGWVIETTSAGGQQLLVVANVSLRQVTEQADALATALRDASEKIDFN